MKSAPAVNATAACCIDEGRRYLQAGDFARAEKTLKQALELAHDCGEAHCLLGEVMAASGRAEDALDCFQLAVHFSPALAAARISLATALLAGQSYADAETECRVALKLDSTSTAGWYCLGNILKARGELEQAVDAFGAAARGNPPDSDALQQLAFVEFRLGRYDDAHCNFRTLLALAPDSHRAHHNFGLLQLETGYAEEALASFRRALELQPDTVESLTCTGHALRDLGRLAEAIAAYDEALRRRPGFGDALSNRSHALLMRGDFAAGWPAYEQRFEASATLAPSRGLPAWHGETLAGKRIVVLQEQGIGDELMFASCLPDLLATAGHCVIECNPRLVTLFARSFPQATVRAANCSEAAHADCQVSAGSLPLHFRATAAAFPSSAGYLKADSARVQFWSNTLAVDAGVKRVGIAWRGGTLRNRRYLRSLNLLELLPVLRSGGCSFVSLQSGDYRSELQTLADRQGIRISEPAFDANADLDELAALIAGLDLVVTVDNTIAHLCGSLGKPVWILLPFSAEWRYARDTPATPWYPSARLFRQPAPRDWTRVVAAIAQALAVDVASCSPA